MPRRTRPGYSCRRVHRQADCWGRRCCCGRHAAPGAAAVSRAFRGSRRGAAVCGRALSAAGGGSVHLPLAPGLPHGHRRELCLPRGRGVRLQLRAAGWLGCSAAAVPCSSSWRVEHRVAATASTAICSRLHAAASRAGRQPMQTPTRAVVCLPNSLLPPLHHFSGMPFP